MKKRTHYCGEINAKQIGKTVTVMGWVDVRRDHGGLIFIDLRDRFGNVQVVLDPEELKKEFDRAKSIRNEFVLALEGKVRKRPKGMENKKMNTGEVEIIVSHLEILNRCPTPPFEIKDETDTNEDLRLQYRFLDIS